MVSIMKIEDDAALNSYLVKHLQPLTEADPNILAKYVWALLKNNKPKNELQAFCAEKLVDFLGEDSKNFVVNLFHALEDGTILTNQDEHDSKVADGSSTMPAPSVANTALTEDNTEPRTSQFQKHTDANSSGITDHEEEGSDDDDDDRNHKHRRRVQRSRSLDGDTQDGPLRKRNRPTVANPATYDNNNPLDEIHRGVEKDGLPKRRFGRDHVSGAPPRLGMDVNQHGVARGATLLRNDGLGSRFEYQNCLSRGVMGRGRGATTALLGGRDPRAAPLDGSDLNLPVLPSGLSKNFYIGRSRGSPLHPSWTGYNRCTGMTNSTLDQALPLNTGMQGSRGAPISAALGVGINIGMGMALRPRCLDFEERGYCLRGDLCPMEHGANRIVIEDVQSLSKFNLPMAIPSGRGMALGTVSLSSSSLAPYSSNLGHSNIVTRETNMSCLDDSSFSKAASHTNANTEPDLYDPDQPLWNKELPSFRKDSDSESVAALERSRRQSPDNEGYGKSSLTVVRPQGLASGQSVWNRIGRTDHSDGKDDSSSFLTDRPVESSHFPKVLKRELIETHEPQNLPSKWRNDLDERAAKTKRSAIVKGGVNSTSEGEVGLHPAGYNPLGGRSLMPPSERAQKTLYVGCIPSNPDRRELLMVHFQKFGDVVDIRILPHGDRAFVQFLRHEDAEAALNSPEAVMGNRFIRLSWAKRDSVPISSVEGTMVLPSIGHGRGNGLINETASIMKGKKQVGATSTASEMNTNKQAAKSGSTVQPSSSAMPQKKHEELEHMKEELRRKQEELAQKRDDFRRKLERLSKQGNGLVPELDNEGVTGARGAGSRAELKEDQMKSKEVMPERQEITIKDVHKQTSHAHCTVEKVLSSSDQAALGLMKEPSQQPLGLGQTSSGNLSQPSPKGLRSHSSWTSTGFIGSSQWTPLRYKLDNRTTVFRVLPPFPDSLLDVTTLKKHFQCFGEVANVEIEELDNTIVANDTGKRTAKVTFCTRNAAEKAFGQGKRYQGTSLHLSWVNPPPSNSAGATSHDSVHVERINGTSNPSSCGLAESGSEDGQSSRTQISAAGGCSEVEGGSDMEGRLSMKKDCVSTFQPSMDNVPGEDLDLETKTDG